MKAKLIGFAAGAAVAVVGLVAYRLATRQSDADLLITILVDHCIPFAQVGTRPFDGLGTPADAADLIAIDGPSARNAQGAVRLGDLRFEAVWGETEGDSAPVRYCSVSGLTLGDAPAGFAVDYPNIGAELTERLAPFGLIPESDLPIDGPAVAGWITAGEGPSTGLRVVAVVAAGTISHLTVAADVD